MKFLIAEDNAAMRQMIGSVITDWADEIVECSDGATAVSSYGEHRPDWVLMDIRMPTMDGLTATAAIKAAWPDAHIVIVTSYNDARLRAAAQQAGACGYVLKEDLLTLRHLLEHEAVAPGSPPT
jgi:CheY-like chemotaxis protein